MWPETDYNKTQKLLDENTRLTNLVSDYNEELSLEKTATAQMSAEIVELNKQLEEMSYHANAWKKEAERLNLEVKKWRGIAENCRAKAVEEINNKDDDNWTIRVAVH